MSKRPTVFAIALAFMSLYPASSFSEVGKPCLGDSSAACSDNEWCNFDADNQCGMLGKPGKCETRPEICLTLFLPVCGCDGKDYSNSCVAHGAGVSVAYAGFCRSATTPGTSGATACVQMIVCGTKNGKIKQYPTPCDAAADGAMGVKPMPGSSCGETR